ncbi:hypothetical protein ERO13_D05G134650v2 [Gossypium hirsutum]|nr:hypothetical protein ERO13_D05G134650v2 [Gossypium hirsutum]
MEWRCLPLVLGIWFSLTSILASFPCPKSASQPGANLQPPSTLKHHNPPPQNTLLDPFSFSLSLLLSTY